MNIKNETVRRILENALKNKITIIGDYSYSVVRYNDHASVMVRCKTEDIKSEREIWKPVVLNPNEEPEA